MSQTASLEQATALPAIQEEAAHAVSLYYDMLQAAPHLPVNLSGAGSNPFSVKRKERGYLVAAMPFYDK